MAEGLERGIYLQNRYRIEKILGKGGFGITYLVLDEETEQYVVVKEYFPVHLAVRMPGEKEISLLSPDYERDYQTGMEKFLAEARTMSSLFAVPEIVKVLNYFQENNGAYLVMEYVKGTSLRKYLERMDDLMTFEQAKEMLLPVIRALGAVHKKGMIHRDLTPDNLLMKEDGSIKIIDFGSAREYVEDEKTKTVLVKSGYAPLEQYSKKEKQGPWTDVYAICATMYEMITGAVPQDALKRMEEDELYEPSLYGAEIEADEEAVIMKGLALDYRERYASMKDFETALFPVNEMEESKKQNRPYLWGLAAVIIVCCVAIISGICWQRSVETKETEVVYAGNFERDSVEYEEYYSFIMEHKLSEAATEDGILYDVPKEEVLAYGLPCNTWRFLKKKENLIQHLEELGYHPIPAGEMEDGYTAEVHQYGAIVTNFYETEFYDVGEHAQIKIRYDAVNHDVLRASVVEREDADTTENAMLAAEMFLFLSEYDLYEAEEMAESFVESLEKLKVQESSMMMIYDMEDTDMMFHAGDAGTNVDYLIGPRGLFRLTAGINLCYWP